MVRLLGSRVNTLSAVASAWAMPQAAGLHWPGILGCIAIILCAQVALVVMWRLLSMVARERIFDPRALRLVDVMTACALAASALFAVALGILAIAGALPPVVAIFATVGCFGAAGIGLLLIVMRGLLTKATDLEHEMAEVV
ncbi:DUF2975 domain-containing protein [Agrococcus sp. 1P02AA]|uniref:DUF2975 domain-containing protein n=1 Tax=Agrococcus sp. 1P02AA TaxID=3132259 RepID=UPI0039A78813